MTNVCLCIVLPHEEAYAQFAGTRSWIFSRSITRRVKHAWDNRCSSNCSLVAWIFRISRNHRFHSHCPSCGPDTTCAAFPERQHSKRVGRWPTPDLVGATVPGDDSPDS